MWDLLLESKPGSDRPLNLFDMYTGVVSSTAGLTRLAEIFTASTTPEGLQHRRWSALQTLTAHDHADAAALLNHEPASDPSDSGRLRAISIQASRSDQSHQRYVMNVLLDPPSKLAVYEARAHAPGLFPFEEREAHLKFTQGVFSRLQYYLSENVDVRYHSAIFGGLLGNICDVRHLDQREAAVNCAETFHRSMRKRLLDMRLQVSRCLDIRNTLPAS